MPIEPNPFDDERLAQVRAEQGDPIVQYFIVRTDIPMSAGKIGAQIGHGAEMFVLRYQMLLKHSIEEMTPLKPEYAGVMEIVEEWLNTSFRKVVLGGKKKDFEKIISELNVFLVRDAGLTEVEPNSETVLVTWPMRKSAAPKCLSRLQTLK
ncbi:peptidyl-tRNA hydrolase [Candidatus Pacearchaeota archaeon]|jgi:PTH2 family peptidyl-tRNA hydrolase|nr:peptidyl-tRNA hydrolase [Candidatus Pacearchaeota archaeon]